MNSPGLILARTGPTTAEARARPRCLFCEKGLGLLINPKWVQLLFS
jgi:hypothetical protein